MLGDARAFLDNNRINNNRAFPYSDLTLFDFTLFQYVKELMSKKGNGIVPETAIYNKV